MRRLTIESFDLDADPPTVTVYGKRKKIDVQPIRNDLADLLRPWLQGRPKRGLIFGKMPLDTARMLRGDLGAARKA